MRTLRVGLAGFAAAAVLVAGYGTPTVAAAKSATKKLKTVQVTAQYRRTIVPSDPANPPTTAPAILPTVTCVRRVGKQKEIVFGYQHNGLYSWDTTLGSTTPGAPHNYFLVGKSTVADLGQLTQFLPGSHPSRFAIRTSKAATWVVQVPAIGNERQFPNTPPIATWQVSIKARNSACAPSVPQHFAFMRSTGGYVPTPHVSYGGTVVHPVLQSYSVDFTPSGGVTVCGPGGVALAPRVLYGYPSDFPDNLVPLAPEDVVRTDRFGGANYTRTAVASRQVVDVTQRVSITDVILDTFGRCQFGSQVLETPDATYGYLLQPAPRWLVRSDDGTGLVFISSIGGGGVRFR